MRATVAILVLTVATTVAGLVVPGYHADVETLARVRSEDVATLAAGVPAMAVGLLRARRRSLPGLVVWLDSVAFSSYVWGSRALQLEFNASFFLHLLLTTLSLFALAAGLAAVDARAVRGRLENRLNTGLFAAALYFLAAGLSFLWLSDIVPAAIGGTTPQIVQEFGPQGIASVVVDLGIIVPAMVIGAVLLGWKRPAGYLAAGVLLVFGALLGPTLFAITIADYVSGIALTPGIILGTAVPPIVSTVFAIKYLLVPKRTA